MLAFVVRNGRLEPRQKALPRIPTGWALVRVRLAGICNTDLELLRGYHNFRGPKRRCPTHASQRWEQFGK